MINKRKMHLKVKEAISVIENFLSIYQKFLNENLEGLSLIESGVETRKVLGLQQSLRTLREYDILLAKNSILPITEVAELYKDFKMWLSNLELQCATNLMNMPLVFRNGLFEDSFCDIYTDDEE